MRKPSTRAAAFSFGLALLTPFAIQAQQLETVSAPEQVKDDLFEGTQKFAANTSDVSEVNMDQKTLQMMGKNSSYGEKAKKLDFIIVRSYEYPKPGLYQMADVAQFRQKLMDGSWSCMVHTQSKTDSTDICVRSSPDHESNELALITAEPTSLTFIHMKGRMSLADLEGMGGAGMPTPPATPPLRPRK